MRGRCESMRKWALSALRRRASCALIGLAVAAPPAAAQVELPTGFQFEQVVTGPFTAAPAGFAFLPDGRLIILEQETAIVRLAAVGSSTAAVIGSVPGVVGAGERGLLGVAVDPGWPARPYVYFHASHTDSSIHVTRYRAAGDLVAPASTALTLAEPYLVLGGIRDWFWHHNAGTLRFGPDGDLYVSTGDDGIGCDSQNVDRLTGKILRLAVASLPDSGSGPPPLSDLAPAQPFFDSSPIARLVYAFGFRNPFRFTIDPWTGDLYIGDVGALVWEEIDAVPAGGSTGLNLGWPLWEGVLATGCCPACGVPPYTAPVHVYANPPDPLSAAVVGGPLYHRAPGSAVSFPFEYEGSLFFADFYSGWLRRLVRSGSDWVVAPPVEGQPSPEDWARGLRFVSDLQVGPDGALWLAKLITGDGIARGVHRIVDTRTTDVPAAGGALHAFAVPNPARGGRGLQVHWRMASPEAARLRILDPAGRLVRSLALPAALSGQVVWDGRTQAGRPAPAGLYLFTIDTPSGRTAGGKIALVR